MDKEMQRALEADGEKLQQLTSEDHGPWLYYDDYDAEIECMHEHYEIDVCTGRAECDYCPKSWYLSTEEIEAELDRQANYHEECEREDKDDEH